MALSITLNCPQCGGPLNLRETEHLVRCTFCKVRHVIAVHPFACLVIPPRMTGDMLFLPYWRFKGMSFVLHQGQVHHRLIDATRIAGSCAGFPFSLGLKVQTQSLNFFQPNTPGTFLKADLSRHEVVSHMPSALSKLEDRSRRQQALRADVGEATSLIYAPVCSNGSRVIDGVSGRELKHASAQTLDRMQVQNTPLFPTFLPALCPYCGWDLAGPRDSLVLFCKGCGRLWAAGPTGFEPRDATFLPGPHNQKPLYLPFWELRISHDGLEIHRAADLFRLFPHVQTDPGQDRQAPPLCRVPAFKIRPDVFIRLARQTTLAPLLSELSSTPQPGSYFPVTLPESEAFEALLPILGQMILHPARIKALFSDQDLKLESFRVVYLPFVRHTPDYVQPELNIALPEQALSFGRSL